MMLITYPNVPHHVGIVVGLPHEILLTYIAVISWPPGMV